MTITVTYKDHAHTREYWVNDGQLKRPIFLPFDSTEEEAIRLFNEIPAAIAEHEARQAQQEIEDEQRRLEKEQENQEATE